MRIYGICSGIETAISISSHFSLSQVKWPSSMSQIAIQDSKVLSL